jgi:LysM repeat protein
MLKCFIKTVYLLATFALLTTKLLGQIMSTQEYIAIYKYAAMEEMKIYKIPASITLGQGILESASGNSKLARECNNHFGIKCRKNWTGTFCLADDDAPNECFRGYPSAMESYRDHSLFLTGNSRYASLFSLAITDYSGWATGLRDAGYATNPSYAASLAGIIEKYRLGMYDSMVLLGADYIVADSQTRREANINGIPAVYARAGQSAEDIAREQDLGLWEIYKYNDLKRGSKLDPGEIVYLKPKRRKGSVETAVVGPGQEMREISQQYGIKLKQLYKKNHLKPGQQVKAGEVLYLRKKSSSAPAVVEGSEKKAEIPKPKPVIVNPASEKKLYPNFYEVQPGETLYSIATKVGVSVEDLMRWNSLEGTNLKPGQILVLKKNIKANGNDSAKIESTPKQLDKSVKFHIVIQGETLYSIGKLYNQPADSIVVWNGLKSNILKPGMELRVSPPDGKEKTNETPRTYTVQAGDTLYSIARKFGLSVADLRKWNNLDSDKIMVGSILNLH